jgi:plasmid maintenance system killer protein
MAMSKQLSDWRIVFRIEDGAVVDVDLVDYH